MSSDQDPWEFNLVFIVSILYAAASAVFELLWTFLWFMQNVYCLCFLAILFLCLSIWLARRKRKQAASNASTGTIKDSGRNSQPLIPTESIGALSLGPSQSSPTPLSQQPVTTRQPTISAPSTVPVAKQPNSQSSKGPVITVRSSQPNIGTLSGTSGPIAASSSSARVSAGTSAGTSGASSSGMHNAIARKSVKRCKLPGCSNRALDVDGLLYNFDFCHINHKIEFDADYCIYPGCRYEKEFYGAQFCDEDHLDQASDEGLGFLLNVDEDSEDFQLATDLFKERWRSEMNGPCPNVFAVLEIINPAVRERFQEYQDYMENLRYDHYWVGKKYDRVERFFHGTVLRCNTLYEYQMPCTNVRCSVCRIIQHDFRRECINFRQVKRFGNAFYFAPNSSKSHAYARTTCGYWAMFLCWVVPGRKYKVKYNEVAMQGPPDGFHSVYGQQSDYGHMENDELVLYNPDAISPKYVLLYDFKET